jgi:hypothetical protein
VNIEFFACVFGLAAFAGLASVLRGRAPVTRLRVFSATLNSGLLGLALSLLWYRRYADDVYYLVGVCLLVGLGGTPTVGFALKVFRAQIGQGDEVESSRGTGGGPRTRTRKPDGD